MNTQGNSQVAPMGSMSLRSSLSTILEFAMKLLQLIQFSETINLKNGDEC
jgi:hypothetical protein